MAVIYYAAMISHRGLIRIFPRANLIKFQSVDTHVIVAFRGLNSPL